MKACATCYRLFPDDGGFCPIDGQKLGQASETPPPRDPEDKRVGAAVCGGRYQIWRRVADGGMGRVYQALDTRNNRSVAMKILHADVSQDAVSVERFKREFECSASLPHESIVEVLAFEETEDRSFALVMEYLEGEELRMYLKREKTMPPERVIRMLAQVARGLQAAHDRKIVHRDLKPDNIFLCQQHDGDIVKILDFGSVRDNSATAKKLTVMGTTIGSPFYMAPEQAQGLPSLDHRADVWSLAAIAYECLTGSLPFQGNNGPAILLAILMKEPDPPSVSGSAQHVPPSLDPVMEEALAKEPNIRVKSVGELVDKMGRAYGLGGDHHVWAKTPQAVLGEQIKAGLPAVLAKAREVPAGPNMAAMDQAFSDDAFKAGSQGGPAVFDEDLVMGVPKSSPKWLLPAIGAVAVVVGALVAFLIIR